MGTLSTTQWSPIGPAPVFRDGYMRVSGRIEAVSPDPTLPGLIIAAGNNGGIWRTQDGGSTWSPLTDFEPSVSFNGGYHVLQRHPQQTNLLVGGLCGPRGGVLVSRDRGTSWAYKSITGNDSVQAVALDPNDPSEWHVAVNGGIYTTTDYGATWNALANAPSGLCDMVATPSSGLFIATVGNSGANASQNGIWVYSLGIAGGWMQIASASLPQGSALSSGSARLTVSGNTLYASFLTNDAHGNVTAVARYVGTDSGDVWTLLSPTPGNLESRSWHHVIEADPANAKHLITDDAYALYESFDGGATWSATNTPGWDWVNVAFGPSNAIYCTADQGVLAYWSSPNAASHTFNWWFIDDSSGFGNLVTSGCVFFSGVFGGNESTQILFYHPSDQNWFLGSLTLGALEWTFAGNTNGFGNLVSSGCRFFVGKFNGTTSDQILFYHPSDRNWWLGTLDGAVNWTTAGNTNGFGDIVSEGCVFFSGDFNGLGGTQIAFYHPADQNWWLGTPQAGGVLDWTFAGNTNGFGNLVSSGCRFFTGDFKGISSDQILFYHPSDRNWFVGTLTNGVFDWTFAGNTNGFGEIVAEGCVFFTGDFTAAGSTQVLFYHPADGNWWLATFANGIMNWTFAGNTTGFGSLVSSGCRFFVGNFTGGTGAQVLFYHPSDQTWFLGMFYGGFLSWMFVDNTNGFANLVTSGSVLFQGNFGGGNGQQIVFYHPSDSHWFLGAPSSRSIVGNLQVTQFYTLALNATSPQTVLGVAQDISTVQTAGNVGWTQLPGGEAGKILIDPNTGTIYAYNTTCAGVPGTSDPNDLVIRSTDGGSTWTTILSGLDAGARTKSLLQATPQQNLYTSTQRSFAMFPGDTKRLAVGTTQVFVTNDATVAAPSWLALGGVLSTDSTGVDRWIQALAMASSDPNVLYAATDDGHVWLWSGASASAWQECDTNISQGIADISVDPTDANHAFAAGGNAIWELRSGAWQNRSGNFPGDLSINTIFVNWKASVLTLFVGTSCGVYASTDSGTTWNPYLTGMPNTQVVDLQAGTQFVPEGELLREQLVLTAGTYGRGALAILVSLPS